MTKESLSRKRKTELVALAKRAKIAGAAAMTKPTLIAALVAGATRRAAKPTRRPVLARRAAGRAATATTTQATESKFYLGERAAETRPPAPTSGPSGLVEPPYTLPPRYGDHRIVAMVRDPWWFYAYWEIDPDKERTLRATIRRQGEEPAGSFLRVYDVTDIPNVEFTGSNAHRWFDIELTGLADNWYIHVEQPGRSYVVDIGIKSRSGRFYTLARSNRLTTPRAGPSDQVDAEWMCPDDEFWRLFGMAGGFGVGRSSMEMKELFEQRRREEISSGAVSSLSSPKPAATRKPSSRPS